MADTVSTAFTIAWQHKGLVRVNASSAGSGILITGPANSISGGTRT